MIVEYQNELMRQNKLLESVINSLSDGILIINDKHNILRATPQITEWFGTKGQEIIGSNIDDYIQISDDTPIERAKNKDVFIKHTPTNNFVMQTIKLSLDDDKKRYVILIKDVTNEREIETLKEDFVATLTHDLKVPIVAESNIINFLLNGTFGEISDKQEFALLNMKNPTKNLSNSFKLSLKHTKSKKQGLNFLKKTLCLMALSLILSKVHNR